MVITMTSASRIIARMHSPVVLLALAACLLGAPGRTNAHSEADAQATPAPLPFSAFFRHPIGPKGLVPTEQLRRLRGEQVQIDGFLARRPPDAPDTAPLILAPVPVHLDDEDEALADDLPAAIAYLHGLAAGEARRLQQCAGRLRVTGRLDIGAARETDDRISFVRLLAASAQCLDNSVP